MSYVAPMSLEESGRVDEDILGKTGSSTSEGDRATAACNTLRKFGEIWTCVFLRWASWLTNKQTNKQQTDGQTDTLIATLHIPTLVVVTNQCVIYWFCVRSSSGSSSRHDLSAEHARLVRRWWFGRCRLDSHYGPAEHDSNYHYTFIQLQS